MNPAKPILYSFRRCPYAMRARMALAITNIAVEHREVSLKNKPSAMMVVSPKGTVPVLVINDQTVLEESRDIVDWAFTQSPQPDWTRSDSIPKTADIADLIKECDDDFKPRLDQYKYLDRSPRHNQEYYRNRAMNFIEKLDRRLTSAQFLIDDRASVADICVMPFIRQFAGVDSDWFNSVHLQHVKRWLHIWLDSDLFQSIMQKHPLWQPDAR